MKKPRLALLAASLAAFFYACGNGGAQPDGGSNDGAVEASSDGGNDGGATSGPRGLYIPTFHQPIVGNANLEAQLALPYVDGFFVSRAWRDVETTTGTYTFDSINADLQAIHQAGKHATLGIAAGSSAPAYICTSVGDGGAGAQCIALVIRAPQGAPTCNTLVLPLPWDPVLQARFNALVKALAADIIADPTLLSTVVDVKVTGFNETDEETILPFAHPGGPTSCSGGDACQDGGCVASDAVTLLEGAGFSDAVASSTLVTLSGMFRNAFPTLPIGSQVSLALQGFGPTVPFDMVSAFVNQTGRPITSQDQGLAAVNGIDPGTLYAYEAGVPVGYQQLATVTGDGGPCLMSHGLAPDGGEVPCDESVLRAVIDNGINNGHASWIELYTQDVNAFPDAAAYAHNRLVGP